MTPSPLPGARRRAAAATSASATERHLQITPATAGAGGVAVLGASLASAGSAHLGLFLFFAAAALLILDAAVAIHTTRRVRIAGSVHPTDLVVGDRFTVELSLAGPGLPLVLALPAGPGTQRLVAEPPAAGALPGVAQFRGLFPYLDFQPESTGLCGFVSCVRTHRVVLPHPLEVGPRPVVPSVPFPDLGGVWGEGREVPAAGGDVVRGVREYVPGDRLRQVHWRATARLGQLVVKETDETQAPTLHVVLDLGAGGEAGEVAAGRAAWYAAEGLRRGYQVLVTTTQEGRTATTATTTPVAVNRALARAVPGRPERPAGASGGVAVLLVTDEGDSWP